MKTNAGISFVQEAATSKPVRNEDSEKGRRRWVSLMDTTQGRHNGGLSWVDNVVYYIIQSTVILYTSVYEQLHNTIFQG